MTLRGNLQIIRAALLITSSECKGPGQRSFKGEAAVKLPGAASPRGFYFASCPAAAPGAALEGSECLHLHFKGLLSYRLRTPTREPWGPNKESPEGWLNKAWGPNSCPAKMWGRPITPVHFVPVCPEGRTSAPMGLKGRALSQR